jgi:hypothetical protein
MATKKATTTLRKTPKVKPNTSVGTCFTIMPFGGWFDTYYESIYVPAIEAAGLMPCRADDLYRPSTIIHDIWSYTQSAKLVLADLSGKNANVFYELGLAHALAKPAILVTESMDDVPFDLRALRVLEYNKNEARWGEVLQQKISAAIAEVLAAPLQSVLPAFLTVKPESKTKAVSEHEKQFLELKREIDLLRSEVARSRFRVPVRIPPNEARDRLETYIRRGMPDAEIVHRLERYGVPPRWVLEQLLESRPLKSAQGSIDLDSPVDDA